jgi:hypothetical protein
MLNYRPDARSNSAGASLLEALVSLAVFSCIAAAGYSLLNACASHFQRRAIPETLECPAPRCITNNNIAWCTCENDKERAAVLLR